MSNDRGDEHDDGDPTDLPGWADAVALVRDDIATILTVPREMAEARVHLAVDCLSRLVDAMRSPVHASERAVIAAAEHVERGCSCEYDYRCSRCDAIATLRDAVDALRAARSEP